MAEILDHGLQLDIRTRRGADWSQVLEFWTDDTHTVAADMTGAVAVSRIFADGQPDIVMSAVTGVGMITVSLSSATTLNMQQNWKYVIGYKDAGGATHALLFGAFLVSQEQL